MTKVGNNKLENLQQGNTNKNKGSVTMLISDRK